MKKLRIIGVLLVSLGALLACSDAGYYVQSVTGHLSVMAKTKPIDLLVKDPLTGEKERQKLTRVLEIRDFAVDELGLPDNDSYRRYADIGRPYVIWNVTATPEFSLELEQWCFPVAGCVSYRGYFDQAEAKAMGDRLQDEGLDVNVYGVPAYSTLRWFSDPVLNTFFGTSEARMAGLIFHELAHQVVYLPGDSAFNEAFAQTVEMEGIRRWLDAKATAAEKQQYHDDEAQSAVFQKFLRETREQLAGLYHQPLPEGEMRKAKRALFREAGERYARLKQTGQLDTRYDAWMKRGLNNARLAAIATYRDYVPGFEALLRQDQGDLSRFYASVDELSREPEPQRYFRLKGRFQYEQFARNQQAQADRADQTD